MRWITGLGSLFFSPASVKGCWGSFWYRSFSGFFQTYIPSFFCSRAINFDQKLHLSCLWNLFPSNWTNYFITIWVCPFLVLSITHTLRLPATWLRFETKTRTHTRLLLFLFTRRGCKINFGNIPRLTSVCPGWSRWDGMSSITKTWVLWEQNIDALLSYAPLSWRSKQFFECQSKFKL